MKYLKSFNERGSFLPNQDQLTSDRRKIKDKIEEISYILNDIDLDVYVGAGSDCVVVTIERKYDDGDTGIETAYTDRSYGAIKRVWEKSLGTNDSYMEFVDRVEEICAEYGYKIYVRSTLNFKEKGVDKHYVFGKLLIYRPTNLKFSEPHVEIKTAIDAELKGSNPGIVIKGLSWAGRKLGLI